jgi:hypothetical protein
MRVSFVPTVREHHEPRVCGVARDGPKWHVSLDIIVDDDCVVAECLKQDLEGAVDLEK